jgi:hypothetical protein
MYFCKLREKILVKVIIIELSLVNFDFAYFFDSFFDESFILIIARPFTKYEKSFEGKVVDSAGHGLLGHSIRPLKQVSHGDSGVLPRKEVRPLRTIDLK